MFGKDKKRGVEYKDFIKIRGRRGRSRVAACSRQPQGLPPRFVGDAKPMPTNTLAPVGFSMAVLMPMTSPRLFSSGPPELPGLIAASVWIMLAMGRPLAEGK